LGVSSLDFQAASCGLFFAYRPFAPHFFPATGFFALCGTFSFLARATNPTPIGPISPRFLFPDSVSI